MRSHRYITDTEQVPLRQLISGLCWNKVVMALTISLLFGFVLLSTGASCACIGLRVKGKTAICDKVYRDLFI
jgi:hypothetical protein